MNLNEYIEWTATTEFELCDSDDPVLYHAFGLVSEAGEVADVLAKGMRREDPGYMIPHLREELGDCLYYIASICRYHGWTLEQLASENREKLIKRHLDNEPDFGQCEV